MTPGVGDVLGERYALKKTVWRTPLGPVWLARDRTLDRAVLIQLLSEDLEQVPVARRAFQKAAARAAQVTHPGLLHVFDIGDSPAFVVFENATGGRLADRLSAGPMRPADAAKAALALARGLEALHERGAWHGSLSPSSVVFDEEGRAKIVVAGLTEVAAAAGTVAARAEQPDGYRTGDPDTLPADADRYALAALLFHMVTGTAPVRGGPSARQVRRSVPPAIDALLKRALSQTPADRPTLDEFVGALAPFARPELKEARRRREFDSSEFRWLVPVLLIVVVAGLALTFGVRLVQDFARSRAEPETSETATPRASRGRPLEFAEISDFDPPPGNGEEHPEDVDYVDDGDPRTAWATLQYSRDTFDGRKRGVGLLFDLGESKRITRARVESTLEGWEAEFRIADQPGEDAGAFRTVREFTATTETTVALPGGTQGRYVLLWITKLVDNEGGSDLPFSAEVAEVQLFG